MTTLCEGSSDVTEKIKSVPSTIKESLESYEILEALLAVKKMNMPEKGKGDKERIEKVTFSIVEDIDPEVLGHQVSRIRRFNMQDKMGKERMEREGKGKQTGAEEEGLKEGEKRNVKEAREKEGGMKSETGKDNGKEQICGEMMEETKKELKDENERKEAEKGGGVVRVDLREEGPLEEPLEWTV